ncbi:MAG: hypothetical protein ACT4PG_13090 [Panacagrimonas sp.]
MPVKTLVHSSAVFLTCVALAFGAAATRLTAQAGDGVHIDLILQAPNYESRRHLHRERLAGRQRYKDGKSEYKYDDGVIKIEEKIDRRADKYEYKYEGPDGKCEEKYDQGKYEYKCD